MLQLDDQTPFVSALSLFPNPEGVDTLYLTTKATFSIGSRLEVAEGQLPLTLVDEYWGEPGQSSLKYASDLHLSKPSTDIVLVGSAHAPNGRPVTKLGVELSVGPVEKAIQVVGDRAWTGSLLGPSTSRPAPFERMPLVWERAFGGVHRSKSKERKAEEVALNPLGRGFRVRRRRSELKGDFAPNLYDPKDPKRPACFGFVAPDWEPRRSYAGTYDATWAKARAPYLPDDFDARYFNTAAADLICPAYLKGGEPVSMTNLSPRAQWNFELPTVEFHAVANLSGRSEGLTPCLETVLLEPDEERMSLVWRAALTCDKESLAIEEVSVALSELVVDGRRP